MCSESISIVFKAAYHWRELCEKSCEDFWLRDHKIEWEQRRDQKDDKDITILRVSSEERLYLYLSEW